MAQRLGRVEQLAQSAHLHQTGAGEGCLIDGRRARHRSGVRCRRLCRRGMASGLEHDHRLQPRHAARRRHELSRLGDALDIHQHGARFEVARQHVQEVAEIDVGHVAHREEIGEADALRGPPVGEAGQHRSRLGDRRDPAGFQLARTEGGVQRQFRRGIADAVGPDQAQQIGTRRPQQAPPPARVGFRRVLAGAGA